MRASAWDPNPSLPPAPQPHTNTAPSSVTAIECRHPAAIETGPREREAAAVFEEEATQKGAVVTGEEDNGVGGEEGGGGEEEEDGVAGGKG